MEEKYRAVVHVPSAGGIYYECLECNEAIYNPICPDCLFKAFKQWIIKYPDLAEKVNPKIRRFLRAHARFVDNSQTCIICANNNVYLCPYCFTDFILNLLRDAGAGDQVIREYLNFFNFDLGDFEGHWGYYEDAIEKGLV